MTHFAESTIEATALEWLKETLKVSFVNRYEGWRESLA